MRRDEEALVTLTIFTNQYPFMLLFSVHLGEVASAVTLSFPFSLSLFFPLSATSCFLLLTQYRGSLPAGWSTMCPSEQHRRTRGQWGRIIMNSLSVYTPAANNISTQLCFFPCSYTAFTKCCLYSFPSFECLLLSVSFQPYVNPLAEEM